MVAVLSHNITEFHKCKPKSPKTSCPTVPVKTQSSQNYTHQERIDVQCEESASACEHQDECKMSFLFSWETLSEWHGTIESFKSFSLHKTSFWSITAIEDLKLKYTVSPTPMTVVITEVLFSHRLNDRWSVVLETTPAEKVSTLMTYADSGKSKSLIYMTSGIVFMSTKG